MMRNKTPLLLFVTCLFACCLANAANCTPYNSFKTQELKSAISNIKLDIPQDTPEGTIIYEQTIGTLGNSAYYRCLTASNSGLIANPSFSTHVTPGPLFAIPGTGLSWYMKGYGGYKVPFYDENIERTTGDYVYKFGATYVLGLVKTGAIPSNTKEINGLLASYRHGGLDIMKFYVNISITHQSASCRSPDIKVNMGSDYTVSDIYEIPPKVPFHIALLDCPKSINKIHYTFKPNTHVIDANMGIVELSRESSARGLGLQLFNDNNQPVALDKNQVFTDNTGNAGGSFQIPLKAAYYRIPTQSLEPGTANSSVTFIMSYF
ncbi:fimbrial protein [Pseudomonas sp. NPDC087817]|uniref:fimbrial protein n=1 Tax=Pseudomonas sp. NPDC087817 TaxID=3364451 RepID=UPI0037F3C189